MSTLKMLYENPSFDMSNEMQSGLPLLNRTSAECNTDPAVILDCYPMLRCGSSSYNHEMRHYIDQTVAKCKPDADKFYFSMLLTPTKVLGFQTAHSGIKVSAQDINLMLNFVRQHDSRLRKKAPCFFPLCVPSISSSYKL
jgi:hypothetical protein